MAWFVLGGVPGLMVGLVLLVAVIRNETDAYFRSLMLNILGGVGAATILYCLVQGLRDSVPFNFMPGEGALLMLLGLFFASAYMSLQELNSERGYYAGLALGAVGVLGLAAGGFRSFAPESNFLVPSGLILMGMSALYAAIALAACVDWPFIVIARRDLAAYFYSPVAFHVLIGMLTTGWFMFLLFVFQIEGSGGGMFEPIVEPFTSSRFGRSLCKWSSSRSWQCGS